MNEIFGKTATSEAGGRPSALQLSSLSKALCCSVPGYTGNGVKQATCKEGLVSLPDPGAKMADASALLTGSDSEAWRDWQICFVRQMSFMM